MASGKEQEGIVNRYADALELIGDRAVANTNAALDRALKAMLRDLRRWYDPFLDPEQRAPSGARANAASIREAASRFQKLLESAQSFMGDAEIRRLQRQFETDLSEAMQLGGNLSAELQQTVSDAIEAGVGTPNTVAVWAASQITTAFIQGETLKFRNEVTTLVTEAIARGDGFRKIQRSIRDALEGSTDERGITKRLGLRQRAELIARSELGNALAEAQLRQSKKLGSSYVRWIATQSERTCPLCVSRHGNIYRVEDVPGKAHPRCMCSLSPVPDEAVEEKDPALRDRLLDAEYWRDSQQRVRKEFQDAQGLDEKAANAKLAKALNQVLPSERYKDPTIEKTAQPVVRF